MATASKWADLGVDDLERLRDVQARYEAVKINPNAFSASETIEAVRAHLQLMGELIERYEVDPISNWNVLASTGVIEIEV